MISVLLALLENDGCSKTDLYGMVSSNPRMPDKLGRAVASRLSDMESLMSGYE